jgi:hypothetical protein
MIRQALQALNNTTSNRNASQYKQQSNKPKRVSNKSLLDTKLLDNNSLTRLLLTAAILHSLFRAAQPLQAENHQVLATCRQCKRPFGMQSNR